jgi:hypothetical protein
VESEQEKTEALNELLKNDLTQRVLEYKRQVCELRETLSTKEKERQVYVQQLNLGNTDPNYGHKILEQQSAKLIEL